MRGLYRTFPLYVRLTHDRYDDIERAEQFDDVGNKLYEELKQEYWDLLK